MKKILLSVLLLGLFSTTANADWHGGYHGYRGGYGSGWVAPALIGGVIGYELSRPQTVVVQQPVYVQPPVYTQQPCPYPQAPVYNQVWANDQYGRGYYVNQFAGCR